MQGSNLVINVRANVLALNGIRPSAATVTTMQLNVPFAKMLCENIEALFVNQITYSLFLNFNEIQCHSIWYRTCVNKYAFAHLKIEKIDKTLNVVVKCDL